MIRKVFKKKPSEKGKIDAFLEKYNLPKAYLSVNRRMVTRGVAVGLFWGLIPMPMQMLAVMATTPFLRFNVPIAISMVWLSNPFTMPPMYYLEYLTGNLILGKEGIEDIELTVEWFSANIGDIFIPLYVGTAFYSVIVTGAIYFLLNWLWIRSVHSEKKERKDERAKKISKNNDK
ncbi:MAG: flagellar biosynthesis protein FlhF [Sulfurovum sp.]|nr:MAG: flagellar biosynthesis protein FlhF [Sulfurovum sp.]